MHRPFRPDANGVDTADDGDGAALESTNKDVMGTLKGRRDPSGV